MGMSSPNPIQVSELSALCQLMGIASGADKAKYLRIVQKLDQVYLSHWAESNKSKA